MDLEQDLGVDISDLVLLKQRVWKSYFQDIVLCAYSLESTVSLGHRMCFIAVSQSLVRTLQRFPDR